MDHVEINHVDIYARGEGDDEGDDATMKISEVGPESTAAQENGE